MALFTKIENQLMNDLEIARVELKAVEASEGKIPTHRYTKLHSFAWDRYCVILKKLDLNNE